MSIMKNPFVIIFGVALMTSCQSEDVKFKQQAVAACVADVQKTLVAPTTFKMVFNHVKPRKALTLKEVRSKTMDELQDKWESPTTSAKDKNTAILEYRRMFTGEDWEEFEKTYVPNRPTHVVLLEYDSKNPMGVPLRSFYICVVTYKAETKTSYVDESSDVDRVIGEKIKIFFLAKPL